MKLYSTMTTEYVGKGHPDKIADQISDAILDLYLSVDENARVAVETMIKDNTVILGGEVKLSDMDLVDKFSVENVVRTTVDNLKFPITHYLDYNSIRVVNLIGEQSKQINDSVDCDVLGAGDQGIMIGYAVNHDLTYMPLGITITRNLLNDLSYNPNYGPDMKSQVTLNVTPDGYSVDTIVVSSMHAPDVFNDLVDDIHVLAGKYNPHKIYANPAGYWTVGGSVADCGITGRKIVVDQYGPIVPVGGGAFSGKDYTKQDRSGAYAARYVAKNLVASGVYGECTVYLSYAIGVPYPVSIEVVGKQIMPTKIPIDTIVNTVFDLTPSGIVDMLNLKRVRYLNTALHGHFGHLPADYNLYPWERLDKVSDILTFVG